jgi:hypothetical protein
VIGFDGSGARRAGCGRCFVGNGRGYWWWGWVGGAGVVKRRSAGAR